MAELLTPEQFARCATWQDDGSVMYDITFTATQMREWCIEKQCREEKQTLDAVLFTLYERRVKSEDRCGDMHSYIGQYFAGRVSHGCYLDWTGPARLFYGQEIINRPTFEVVSVVDSVCSLRAIVPINNVERWLYNTTIDYACEAIARGVALNDRAREMVADLFGAYMRMNDMCIWGGDMEVDWSEDIEFAFDELFDAMPLPFVPAKWYDARRVWSNALAVEGRKAAEEQTAAEKTPVTKGAADG